MNSPPEFVRAVPPSPLVEPKPASGFQSLDRRHITVDRIASLIFTGVVFFGMLVGMTVAFFTSGFGWLLLGLAIACFALISFLTTMAFVWPPIEYKYASWQLSEDGLEIRRGVLWRHEISIPIARVQHADVSQGPLQRQFGIGKLVVHTAGTQNASVELNGLAHEVAVQLRDEVVKQKRAVDVV